MTLDSNRPIAYRVSIANTSLSTTAPANGFLDPIRIENYINKYILLGTVTNPTLTNGEIVIINGISITFFTGSLDLATMVTLINTFSEFTHVVASAVTSKLQLTNENGYEGNAITVTGLAATLASIGYTTPVLTARPGTLPTDKAAALTKARGNIRWNMLVEQLSRDTSPYGIVSYDLTGGTVDAPPTAIAFTILYNAFYQVRTRDESNAGVDLYGVSAIKRMVARALMASKTVQFGVYDPTMYSTDGGEIVKGVRMEAVEVGALTATLATAEATATVTIIANTR